MLGRISAIYWDLEGWTAIKLYEAHWALVGWLETGRISGPPARFAARFSYHLLRASDSLWYKGQ